ncbi:hypothetical protein LTR53_007399 [Teratosphaeriaceae sp. CCFEE 6253]|nr:hypothetical protein LTR53_007399 [Teratosphaeriaceae sp. CCFEE 6253]
MILIYSDDHEPAPLLDTPLVEQNVERRIRPIIRKMRKVRGKTGWMLRRYGYIFGAPKGDQVGLAHHALQIGDYVYELTREKYLVGQRLCGHQVWPSTVGHIVIGYTDLSDEDIQMESLKSQAFVRGRYGGKYHIKHNNCQTFIGELLRRLANLPLDYDSDSDRSAASSLSDVTVACAEKALLEVTASARSSNDTLVDVDVDVETAQKARRSVVTVVQSPAPVVRRADLWKSSHAVTASVVSVCA